MNNQDRYYLAYAKSPLEAAKVAIQIGRGKASKSASWTWANTAIDCLIEAGFDRADCITAAGRLSYPDFDRLAAIYKPPPTIIITRHKGVTEWLAKQGITGDVIDHLEHPDEIRGKVVIGNLPLMYAAAALEMASIEMPRLPADMRGKELTAEQMDDYGAVLVRYKVTALEDNYE